VPSAEGIDYEAPAKRPDPATLRRKPIDSPVACFRRLPAPAAEQRGYLFFAKVPANPVASIWSASTGSGVCYSLVRFGFSCRHGLLRSVRRALGPAALAEAGWENRRHLDPAILRVQPWSLQAP